ncbi:MAG: hypothetical protein LBH69_01160 [Methanomassiliicoccaceae archaeon]|jgi:hypothetical protein|nr:hypothetical protein [Methanomassiliicoccaceae archaeon]
MGSKIYLALAIASIVAMVIVFGAFIVTLVSGDIFYGEVTVASILITIFLFLGLILLCVFLFVFFLMKYAKSKGNTAYVELTKKCISCGTTIGVTELSCPRCFTLQPPGGSSPSVFRKK